MQPNVAVLGARDAVLGARDAVLGARDAVLGTDRVVLGAPYRDHVGRPDRGARRTMLGANRVGEGRLAGLTLVLPWKIGVTFVAWKKGQASWHRYRPEFGR